MIDEKKLALMEGSMTSVKLTHPETAPEVTEWMQLVGEQMRSDWREVFRLARLGLWAENHGIPALKFYGEHCAVVPQSYSEAGTNLMKQESMVTARRALAQLPKEKP
jgi:hypothetical protein